MLDLVRLRLVNGQIGQLAIIRSLHGAERPKIQVHFGTLRERVTIAVFRLYGHGQRDR